MEKPNACFAPSTMSFALFFSKPPCLPLTRLMPLPPPPSSSIVYPPNHSQEHSPLCPQWHSSLLSPPAHVWMLMLS
jgi:hypothetical protein